MRYYIAEANTGNLISGWHSTAQRANTRRDNMYDFGKLTYLVKAANRTEAIAKAAKAYQMQDWNSAAK